MRKPTIKHVQLDKDIVKNITNLLKCNPNEICDIELMKIGLTNISFEFVVKGKRYVYRHPGKNTNIFINRESEVYSESIAKQLGLDKTIIWIDESGWKLSKYIENSTQIDPYNKHDQRKAMKLIKKLHDAEIISKYDFDYVNETKKFIKIFNQNKTVDFTKYKNTQKEIVKINTKLNELGYKKVLCHNDYWFYNILKDKNGRLSLIDWEYSGNSYPACDVAYFTSSLKFSDEDYIKLAELYEGHKLSNNELFYYESVMAITMWYWFVWALYKESIGTVIDDKYMWYEKAIRGLQIAKKYK